MSVRLTKSEIFDGPCKAGQGDLCCRYLAFGALPGSIEFSFQCAKYQTGLATTINYRVSLGQIKAQGDNCEGREP